MLEKIKKFDIESAKEVLASAEKEMDSGTEKPVLDPQFGSILESLCNQLNSYRPYLPNWLLMGDEAGTTEGEGEIDYVEDEDDEGPLLSEGSSIVSAPPELNLAGLDQQSVRSTSTQGTVKSMKYIAPVAALNCSGGKPTLTKTLRRISMCVLDFEPKRGKLDKEHQYLESVQAVLDVAAKAAKTTHASLHGTTGDQIIVTWNASVNTAQPELKACQFLCQVKAQLQDQYSDVYGDIALSAAAKSGQAWCHHVVSTTGSKSSSFMIHYLWRSALEAMCRHARSYRTLLVDDATFELGQLQCEGWLVDALKLGHETLPSGDRVESYASILDNNEDPQQPQAFASVTSYTSGSQTTLPLVAGYSVTSVPGAGISVATSRSPALPALQGSRRGGGVTDCAGEILLCYELIGEKKVANDEWLYVLQENAAAPHEQVSELAKSLWCAPRRKPQSTSTPQAQDLGGSTTSQTPQLCIPDSIETIRKGITNGTVRETPLLRRFMCSAELAPTVFQLPKFRPLGRQSYNFGIAHLRHPPEAGASTANCRIAGAEDSEKGSCATPGATSLQGDAVMPFNSN